MTFSTDNFDSIRGIFTSYCSRVNILAGVSRAILTLLRGSINRTMTIYRNDCSSASILLTNNIQYFSSDTTR